jgi:RNA polymerase sigma-70 factor, ECF subfamily
MDVAEIADAEIAERIGQGADRGAEAELCRRFGRRIRLYGLRHLRSEAAAADLVQQVLLTVIQSLRGGKVREASRLASFVLGTCRMIARGQRREALRHDHLLATTVLPQVEPHEPASSVDLERLRRCLEGLPHRERTVVIATFYGERDSDQIADELGMSSGNVRVVRHRAVAHLKGCMDLP